MRPIIQGEENERKRLSKDLHDSLIQQLAAAKFHLNSTLGIVKAKK
jgi:signal transduction histidine kinase